MTICQKCSTRQWQSKTELNVISNMKTQKESFNYFINQFPICYILSLFNTKQMRTKNWHKIFNKVFLLEFPGKKLLQFQFELKSKFWHRIDKFVQAIYFFSQAVFFYSPSDIERPMWYNVTTSSERRKVPILIFHFFFWKLKENCLRVHKVQFSFWIISHQILKKNLLSQIFRLDGQLYRQVKRVFK